MVTTLKKQQQKPGLNKHEMDLLVNACSVEIPEAVYATKKIRREFNPEVEVKIETLNLEEAKYLAIVKDYQKKLGNVSDAIDKIYVHTPQTMETCEEHSALKTAINLGKGTILVSIKRRVEKLKNIPNLTLDGILRKGGILAIPKDDYFTHIIGHEHLVQIMMSEENN